MAELELSDRLILEDFVSVSEPGEVSVEIINAGGVYSGIIDNIPASDNLVAKAVKRYMASVMLGGRFVFSLEKNIPAGAGLGGGSGNAATALMLVSSAIGRGFDPELLDSAAKTGSDVPFFLYGGVACVYGRGESVKPVDYTGTGSVILVNNGIHIDTGQAYRSLGRDVTETDVNYNEKISQINKNLTKSSEWKNCFRNDFEEVIFLQYPVLRELKDGFYSSGAFFSAMTGSGSTVFGLYEDEKIANNEYEKLIKSGNNAYITKFHDLKN